MAARSGFLKRKLKGLSELTLSPPLKITAETFSLIAEFCYDSHIVVTPFNVAALNTAAELLEMTEANNIAGGENLAQKTEAYFRGVIAVNREYASIVLRSCVSLLPECETTSSLLSRCVEALSLVDNGDSIMKCLSEVKELLPVEFQLIVKSMNRWLSGSHDQLYRVVDLYLKVRYSRSPIHKIRIMSHKLGWESINFFNLVHIVSYYEGCTSLVLSFNLLVTLFFQQEYKGKITDEEKVIMCNYIDCSILSPQLLMHAVQNARMPLRFVVQAMFIEQLSTRRSILTTTAADNHNHHIDVLHSKNDVSLGAILERDAALRQVSQLKAAMNATSSRIQSLEQELSGMKKLLNESDQNAKNDLSHNSARSASFRLSSENKIDRGQIGSVSSASFRILTARDRAVMGSSNSSEVSYEENTKVEKINFSRRFMNGLKNAFRVPKKKTETKVENVKEAENGKQQHGEVVVIEKDVPFRRQPRSLD